MRQSFTARVLSANVFKDLNAFVVCLAERQDGSGRRLELQRALSFDEQDRQCGMDTYCLSTESGASHYGGVRSWRLTQGVLTIELEIEAAEALGMSSFEVKIQATQYDVEQLVAGLRLVLGDSKASAGML